jgi:hypothetical protein
MKNFLLALAVVIFTFVANTGFADTRPNPPPKRTHEQTVKLMKLGKYVRCSMTQDFLLQTKEGLSTPDNDDYSQKVLLASVAPEPSSSEDFATHLLFWENEDFSFYFYMNSQVGEIRISDKKKRLEAETDLDLSDFAKQEVFIGKARLIQRDDLLVTSPEDPNKKVPGERFTYLNASCQFLNGFNP